MDKYIGTKIIHAEEQMKDNKEGYKVVYADGYESWSPKDVFEDAYRRCDNITFGLAIEALKRGYKVARKGWNGKRMYLYMVNGTVVDKDNLRNEASKILPDDAQAMHDADTAVFLPHIDMRTANGDICVGWLASQTDMLSDDWVIIE